MKPRFSCKFLDVLNKFYYVEYEKEKMITITFNCENHNHVALLTTLYDLLTDADPDGSLAILDNIEWLFDELGSRLPDVHAVKHDDDGIGLTGFAGAVKDLYIKMFRAAQKEDNEHPG